MSRVYDAMRRKAEEQKGSPSVPEATPAWASAVGVDEDVLSELQAEGAGTVKTFEQPLPSSSPQEDPVARQEIRPTTPPPLQVRDASPAPPAAATPAIARSSVAAPAVVAPQPPATSRLFEHVDVRYKGKIVLDTAVSPQSREQYRRLAASLHHA